jgi:hypothetical protein
VPDFCRHGRFVERCRICTPPQAAPPPPARTRASGGTRSAAPSAARRGGGVVVRRTARAAEDGYANDLVPGLKASGDARRLADELAFATARLAELAADPPGLYGDAALAEDPDLAFLITYLGPLEGNDPWAGVRAAREGRLDEAQAGPRTAHDPARGTRTLDAWRAWRERPGALAGDAAWTPERRFDRLLERLSLPGFGRPARYDLLVVLGRLGLADVVPTSLQVGTDDEVTLAAKRVFGIGDKFVLERRATELAQAAEVPVEALDLALWNFGARERATMGSRAEPDETLRDRVRGALRVV